jgi:regulator of cell morphogenesis and NO signaling
MEHLKEFEIEFHVHLHIENNILFPKVIALEEQLNNSSNNNKQA